jgi:Ran GTPase-activating protein (RanGAP) involved in mRNA processing and transport
MGLSIFVAAFAMIALSEPPPCTDYTSLVGCTAVRLIGQHIGDGGARELAQALGAATTVLEIVLYNAGIGESGARAIASAARAHPTLEKLNLNSNQIGLGGVTAVAGAFSRPGSSIREIQLDSCGIDDAGAAQLAMMLASGPAQLRRLDLGGNVIGDKGAHSLAGGLRANHILRSLELGGNHIGDGGAIALAGALTSHNLGLVALGLEYNRVGDSALEHVAHALEHNRNEVDLTTDGRPPHPNPASADEL